MIQFNSILKEFENFVDGKVKSMPEIEWWLLKYSECFKETHKSYCNQYLFEFPDGTVLRDAPILKPNHLLDFLNLYDALDQLSKIHRNEKYYEEEINEYYKIKDSKIKLKNWVEKNEKYGNNDLASFWVDYLDYSENEEEIYHLSVYTRTEQDFEIFVQRENFKSLIDFKNIFDALYYVQN